MDSLQEVIHSLDSEQQKEFVSFIHRNKYRKGRKDLQLFNLLKQEKEWSAQEIVQQLKTTNTNAYHTIRKRLFSHLADFVVLQSTSSDASTTSHTNAIIGVVNYLFDKSLVKQAWKYLLLAENIAHENELRDLLNTIYLLQISKCHLQSKIDIGSLVQKYEANQIELHLNERLQIASSLIRNRLLQDKQDGINANFDKLVQLALKELAIDKKVLKTPKINLEFVKIIRSGIIAQKDFSQFEPFILSTYNDLYSNPNKESNAVVKAEFLYIIAHTLYRNKKFKLSLSYLNELSSTLTRCSASNAKQYHAKMELLKAGNLMFSKQLHEALKCLFSLEKSKNLSAEEKAITTMNIGIYHYLENDMKKAQQKLRDFTHSDAWYKKTMGTEWLFKKYLMEIILFVDLKQIDIVESRIRTVERTFKNLRNHPIYERAFGFLGLIKLYFSENDLKKLEAAIEKNITFIPFEQEDLQAMTFYCWIRSKTLKKGFYETLLMFTGN
jgi:hypothetical protein